MKCEFSERNYEKNFDFELNSGNPFFSPTPNKEKTLGFDSATQTDNEDFWRLWDPNWIIVPPRIPNGVNISKSLWKWVRGIPKIQHFPKMRANVFLQYKIPHYLKGKNSLEYKEWDNPYFRYEIEPVQFKRLSKLENNVSNNAVVAYASPEFYTDDDLMNHFTKKTTICNSNFAKPSSMEKHSRYTYDTSGRPGIGFSKPEHIPKIDLKNEIQNLIDSSINDEEISLDSLSMGIKKTVEQLDKTFQKNFEKTKNYFHEMNSANNEANSFINIISFTHLTNLSWFIVS